MISRDSLMTLTPDVVVERIIDLMGNDPENYGVQWIRDIEGYKTRIGDTNVMVQYFLPIGMPAMAYTSKVYLVLISPKGEKRIIEEPNIHISQTPLGRLLRLITWFPRVVTGSFGRPFPKEVYPKNPESLKDLENEKVRIGLQQLYLKIIRQFELRKRREREEYLKPGNRIK